MAEQVPAGLPVTGDIPCSAHCALPLPWLVWQGRTCPRGQDFGLGHTPEVTHMPSAGAGPCSLSRRVEVPGTSCDPSPAQLCVCAAPGPPNKQTFHLPTQAHTGLKPHLVFLLLQVSAGSENTRERGAKLSQPRAESRTAHSTSAGLFIQPGAGELAQPGTSIPTKNHHSLHFKNKSMCLERCGNGQARLLGSTPKLPAK